MFESVINKIKQSKLTELVGGIAAGAASGVLAYSHFAGSDALQQIRQLPVWDADILSDPGNGAVAVGFLVFCVAAHSMSRLRNYCIKMGDHLSEEPKA